MLWPSSWSGDVTPFIILYVFLPCLLAALERESVSGEQSLVAYIRIFATTFLLLVL